MWIRQLCREVHPEAVPPKIPHSTRVSQCSLDSTAWSSSTSESCCPNPPTQHRLSLSELYLDDAASLTDEPSAIRVITEAPNRPLGREGGLSQAPNRPHSLRHRAILSNASNTHIRTGGCPQQTYRRACPQQGGVAPNSVQWYMPSRGVILGRPQHTNTPGAIN